MRASQSELDAMWAVPIKELLAREPDLTDAQIAKRLGLNTHLVWHVRRYVFKQRRQSKPVEGLAVLEMLQAGRRHKEIAVVLHCSLSTIQKVVKDAEMVQRQRLKQRNPLTGNPEGAI